MDCFFSFLGGRAAMWGNLLDNNNIKEIVYSALPYNSEEENVSEVLYLMKKIKVLTPKEFIAEV